MFYKVFFLIALIVTVSLQCVQSIIRRRPRTKLALMSNRNETNALKVEWRQVELTREQFLEMHCKNQGYKKSSIGENNNSTRWIYNLSEPRMDCPTAINKQYKFLFYVLCYNDRTCYKAYHVYGCFAW